MQPPTLPSCKLRQRGMMLTEVAMALAISGIVLAGVSVARDLIREAEARNAYQFVTDWKRLYDLHYTRTGAVLGDNQIAPTYMISGAEAVINNRHGGVAGIPANYSQTGLRLCRGQGYPRNSVGQGDPPSLSSQNLHLVAERAGLSMPAGRAEGQEDRFVYQDRNGNPVELQVCFQWNPHSTLSGSGNVMVVRGVTPDLARRLDRMIDGYADAIEGSFREQDSRSNAHQGSNREPGREWGADVTYRQQPGWIPSMFRGTEARDGEGQVRLLTVHWKMEQ